MEMEVLIVVVFVSYLSISESVHVFIKLHITAQSGPVILLISHSMSLASVLPRGIKG